MLILLFFCLQILCASESKSEIIKHKFEKKTKQSELERAILRNDISRVQELLESSPGLLTTALQNGLMPLDYALSLVRTQVVNLLLRKGVPLRKYGLEEFVILLSHSAAPEVPFLAEQLIAYIKEKSPSEAQAVFTQALFLLVSLYPAPIKEDLASLSIAPEMYAYLSSFLKKLEQNKDEVIRHSYLIIIEHLLAAGVNLNQRNNFGETIFDIVMHRRLDSISQLLIRHSFQSFSQDLSLFMQLF